MTSGALAMLAAITWYAVDPMGEMPYLPDRPPAGGDKDAPVMMVAARGEYEPGSFVLVSDSDLGKAKLEVGDLKNERGEVFSKGRIDLKTVKVWYQNGNGWTSYFADPKLKLCPELLLNDEDLVKVDTKKGWNYARLTEQDGSVSYRWLNATLAVDSRVDDAPGTSGQSFQCMKKNFCDAKTHQGVTLRKGEHKQIWLTVEVGKDVKAGLYRGEVKVKGEGEQWNIPLVLKVLDFELPEPKCYFDVEKDFRVWFCEYVGLEKVMCLNGGDAALAEEQLVSILKDFVRHGETRPCFRESMSRPDLGRKAGMVYDENVFPQGLPNIYPYQGEPVEMRYRARRAKEVLTAKFGWKPYLYFWGDEYGLRTLRGARDMVKIYHDVGFRFPVNSLFGYEAGGYLADLWWPAGNPDGDNAGRAFKYNQLGGDGYLGWYACQHVGSENPAFNRRQYGFGPYRAGLSCNFNYAHHLDGWNDLAAELYKPMMLVYGTGDGCVDTIAWEGVREGLDDIRYATKLKQLAEPLVKGTTDQRYAAKKALQLLADADGDDMDLTTLRLEMIRHIERLMALK